MELLRSSPQQADVHRTVAFRWVQISSIGAKRKKTTQRVVFFLLKVVTCFNTKWTYSCLFVKIYAFS